MNLLNALLHILVDNALHFFLYFSKLNKKIFIFNSTGNNNFNFNSRFLYEYMTEIQDDEIQCYFVVNDNFKRKSLLESGVKNIISGKNIKNKVLILSAKTWICSTIETPLTSVFKKKNRIVYHLGHGVPLKNIGMAENKIPLLKRINRYSKLRVFTHVTCYSDFFQDVLYRAFNKNNKISYMKLGQPRNDSILWGGEREKKIIERLCLDVVSESQFISAKKILYCPTWRNYATTRFFPFHDFDASTLNDYLEKNNVFIFTREHPYYKFHLPAGIEHVRRIIPLNSNILSDITPHLSFFDLLLTDYSSIFIDFLVTGKSVIFIPYDLECYDNMVGFSKPYSQIAVGNYVNSFSDFLTCISDNSFESYSLEYLNKFNIKSTGNCLEHYNNIKRLVNLA
ncbi:CDP-glycerol glycerophosphotransferase family protein [Citrobacter sp. S2-9]|uniref:CDP-glycerol glycerophosphotransferase family protein n=1 Tax=Citrobacter enshiensis TaxID=2971264 RepID=A0ABT8PTF6_9ENTR|nr:CDP-glycerol glycerophosphotransferase family protein [Citrobacter enshiensis]MDN8599605.1 CDP-glycerol glycerophosphotransferase family protein [Citrobacter enshiensis]